MGPDLREKDAAAVRIFPPAVPLLAILAGVGLNRAWPLDVGPALPAPGRYWLGGVIVVAAILGLGVWPVVLFRRSGQTDGETYLAYKRRVRRWL